MCKILRNISLYSHIGIIYAYENNRKKIASNSIRVALPYGGACFRRLIKILKPVSNLSHRKCTQQYS